MDRFAAFVEVVAASLIDEMNNRAEELAGRLFLSRAQCDRIVRTAAGETPASQDIDDDPLVWFRP